MQVAQGAAAVPAAGWALGEESQEAGGCDLALTL